MPGRASCEECRELSLNTCDNCTKPRKTDFNNTFAIDVFSIARRHDKTDYLTLTIAKSGTEDDYNKVLLIDSINRRINGGKE